MRALLAMRSGHNSAKWNYATRWWAAQRILAAHKDVMKARLEIVDRFGLGAHTFVNHMINDIRRYKLDVYPGLVPSDYIASERAVRYDEQTLANQVPFVGSASEPDSD